MISAPYMPLFVSDYLKDTVHLTAAENGAYLMLIMNYWQRQKPLPDDDRKLAAIARMTREEWQESRQTIAEFFEARDGEWHHKRIDAELSLLVARAEKNAAAGRASGASRRGERTPVEQPLNERSASVEQPLNHKAKQREEKKEEPGIESAQLAAVRAPENPSVDQTQEPLRTRIAVAALFAKAKAHSPDTSRVGLWIEKGYTGGEIETVIADRLARGKAPSSLAYFDQPLAEIRAMPPPGTGPPSRKNGGGFDALEAFIEMERRQDETFGSDQAPFPRLAIAG